MLEDDVVLRFRGSTNTYKIVKNTPSLPSRINKKKLSLRCWLLFIMLYKSLVNRFMTIGSLATHRKNHRKHDYRVDSSHANSHIFSCYMGKTGVPETIKR